VLRRTGNPVFDPASADSLGRALDAAFDRVDRGKGAENARYAQEKMSWSDIADQHIHFYRQVQQVRGRRLHEESGDVSP
jgi:hypothetical protein